MLAAYGADVLRIDPPGFAEVPALLADTTVGKRRAALDLRTAEGRAILLRLAAAADVMVCGYRSSALERLGLGVDALRAASPALAIIRLDAYGWTGPWRDRRGFDSLVQMSTGIARRSRDAVDGTTPGMLPAQALDHGAGYVMAAAACRAITRRWERGVATTVRVSLARMARLLVDLGDDGDPHAPALANAGPYRDREDSGFGPLSRVRCPGALAGCSPRWTIPAGPLGSDPPAWP
jgi:crotonobetainyl-CoA:carnitine CoA-transferase CaiB-like acyl-CoA transferase